MRKFTVFTVILTVVVVVMLADFVVNEYLPGVVRTKDQVEPTTDELTLPDSLDVSKAIHTDVLGFDSFEDSGPRLGDDVDYYDDGEIVPFAEDSEAREEAAPLDVIDPAELKDVEVFLSKEELISDLPIALNEDSGDFESENFEIASPNVFIREDQVRSAGFVNAYLEEEAAYGLLYKTVQFDDLPDTDVTKFVVRDDESLFAKVYVFEFGRASSADEVYEVLKIRGSSGLDIEINESNDFGDESFYMNDTRRQNVAFLTVKFGAYLYGFSYPKEYHGQIQNLILFIEEELFF